MVTLLKSKANIYAFGGILIAVCTTVAATLLVAYLYSSSVTLGTLITVQRTNPALWLLDCLPFVFALWGQYSGTLIAYQAGAMVMDETQNLSTQVSALRYQLENAEKRYGLPGLAEESAWPTLASQALNKADENTSLLAILAIDFDQFHELHDVLSRREREALLKNMGARLQGALRANDTLTHMGDDEFAVLLPGIKHSRDVGRLGERLQTALGSPLRLGNKEVLTRARIGVALFPNHGTDADALLEKARAAKEQARQSRSPLVIYRQRLEGRSGSTRLQLLSELRTALDDNTLTLLYSAQTDDSLANPTHVRANLAWEPRAEKISEARIWELAEQAGVLRQLLSWLLDTGIGHLAQWQSQRNQVFHISFPLPESVWRELPVVELLKGVAAAHEVAPNRVILECTEDALLGGGEHAMSLLRDLRAMGARLSLAGFGGPQSSPSALLDFHFDEVRLARPLVTNAAEDEDSAAVLTSLLTLARRLDIDGIVPGINGKLLFEAVHPLQCDRLEGAYIAQPQTADALLDWIGLQTMHQVNRGGAA